jgi:hypothetical protein
MPYWVLLWKHGVVTFLPLNGFYCGGLHEQASVPHNLQG